MSPIYVSGLLVALAGAEAAPERYDFAQIQMGVSFRISVYACDEGLANDAAEAAFARVRELDERLSNYRNESELMRLCRLSGPGKPVRVSDELYSVLEASLALSKRTDGAFDATVGPLSKLWRKARRRKELPSPERVAAERKNVGWQQVRLDPRQRTVELMRPQMLLDLGGIAKGYAADEALRVLRQRGMSQAMVDASGDIVVGDAPPGTTAWKIGVAPLKPDAAPSRYLLLANAAVATSGDAYQYIEIGGKRYSHIIDPKTGLGLTTPSSVTVIAKDGITADSLASAVSVLGAERGIALIEKTKGTAALVVQRRGEETVVTDSQQFRRYEKAR